MLTNYFTSLKKQSQPLLPPVKLQLKNDTYCYNKLCHIYEKVRKKDKFYFNKTIISAPPKMYLERGKIKEKKGGANGRKDFYGGKYEKV